MNIGDESRNLFREHVKRLTTPIFEKVLHETRSNRMAGRVVGVVDNKVVRIRPHNYRLFFDFNTSEFKPPVCEGVINPGTGVGLGYDNIVSSIQYSLINSRSTHCFVGYYGCRILVRKKSIEINPVDFTKDSHYIKVNSQEEIVTDVLKVFDDIDSHIMSVLKCFIEDFGGSSSYTLSNASSESKIEFETGIDRIDRNLTFHGELVKKVYPGKGNVEFKDPVSALNYLQNRAIENVAPEIAKAINDLMRMLGNQVMVLKEQINCYDDIVKFSDVIINLNESERSEFSEWISLKFNGVLIE